jgi:hypothetical protein
MVLMALRPGSLGPVLAACTLLACVQPNAHGTGPRLDGAADAPAPGDGAPDTWAIDAATAADRGGVAAPPDAAPPPPDTAGADQGPDLLPTECTPRENGCTADGRAIRVCDDQGRWTVGTTCGAQTACSAGLCLCTPESCDEGTIHEAPGLVEAIAGSGTTLFLGLSGPRSSIRSFDVEAETAATVHMGGSDFTRYALDADAMGSLVWCSEVGSAPASTGQLGFGATLLDTPAGCVHVRKIGDVVYYRADDLYRRSTGGSPPQTVSSAPMTRFEIAGEHLYLIGAAGEEAVLKRFALAEPAKVETLLRRPDGTFRRLAVDGAHAYVVADDRLLRVPLAGNAAPEDVWVDEGPEVWGLALSDSHVYWSTTTPDLTGGCLRAQVWRRPKAGGTRVAVSTVQGRCAGELFILAGRLYTAVFQPSLLFSGPSEVLRLRL